MVYRIPVPGPGLSFALSILNAAKLQIELDRSTQDYLTDVTSQLSRDIRDAINNRITSLVMTADSFSQFTQNQDTDTMSGFLNRTAQILEFNPLIFFNREGFSVSSHTDNSETPASPEDFLKLPSVRASFQGSIQASYIGGKSIFIPSLSTGTAEWTGFWWAFVARKTCSPSFHLKASAVRC